MVAEGEILVPERPRRQRHLLDGRLSVRPGRVAVEVAAQVGPLDEHGQLALPRRLELAPVLAQLGRDVRVAEVRVGSSSSAAVNSSPVSVFVTEYSETERPRRTSSRSATLCSFEPVKCWSRFP